MLPSDANTRKTIPVWSGVLAYFPDAIIDLARCSAIGGDRHHPGAPVHWERGKSADHEDSLLRHLMERGTVDDDGVRHSAKVAWRALAMLQLEIEAGQAKPPAEINNPNKTDWMLTGCADDCTHPDHAHFTPASTPFTAADADRVHRIVPRSTPAPRVLPLCTCRGTQCIADPKWVRCRLKASLHAALEQAAAEEAD